MRTTIDDPLAAADDVWSRPDELLTGDGDLAAHGVRYDQNDAPLLEYTIAADLAGRAPPERRWLVPNYVPLRQVTLLTGNGGDGKSLAALHLQVAVAAGKPWFGLPAMQCKSFGLYTEDEDDELERRIAAIAEATNIGVAELTDMATRSAVVDPAELVSIDFHGELRPTTYFRRLERTVKDFRARLVVLDAAANLYGGDELKRRQVITFIGLLRRLSIDIDGAVLLIAHPSAQGIISGSGISGSTHWHNSVRSRLYLLSTTGDDAVPNERILTCRKANYGPRGGDLRLRWTNGAFVSIGAPTGVDRAALIAKADRVFLALLTSTYGASTWASPNRNARNYAPTAFALHPDREGLGKEAFEQAMHRLIKGGLIKSEEYGRPSDQRTRLTVG
jgi:hypothetical protein